MTQKTLDFARFSLAEPYTPATDTQITIIAESDIYSLDLQKQGGTLTQFRLSIIEKEDTTKRLRIGLEDVASSSVVNGKKQYVVNIRLSDQSNLMVGLANDDDGTNNDANIIASNLTDLEITTFSKESSANLVVGSGEFNDVLTELETAVEKIEDETTVIAASQNSKIRQNNARLTDQQNTFETDITDQQNTFETNITTQQTDFETEQQQNFDNFTATQRDITGVKDDTISSQLNLSGGSWLDGTTELAFTAANVTPALSTTTFYELSAGTGALASNTTEFTSGAFPICKVTTDATEITEVKNYGAAYQIGGSGGGGGWDGIMTNPIYTDGLLTSLEDSDGTTWTQTYDSDGDVETITDGADTYTINRDADGNFIGVTIS